jgi:ATP-dependent DNA helicase RecQ
MALTATAVADVRDDIAQVLRLVRPLVAQNSSDRTNLRVTAVKKRGAAVDLQYVADQAAAARGSVIVYCTTVKDTEQVAEALRHKFQQQKDSAIHKGGSHGGLERPGREP